MIRQKSLNTINHFFIKEPTWRELSQWSLSELPVDVADWLQEEDSLTSRIKSTFAAPFSVTVEDQGLAEPFLADAQQLNQPAHVYSLIREVQLNVGGSPVVFARTTLPKAVADDLQELAHLGNKPLGEVIFSYPDLERVQLDVAKIETIQLRLPIKEQTKGCSSIWARRNTYQINQRVFLVSEFFLPALFTL